MVHLFISTLATTLVVAGIAKPVPIINAIENIESSPVEGIRARSLTSIDFTKRSPIPGANIGTQGRSAYNHYPKDLNLRVYDINTRQEVKHDPLKHLPLPTSFDSFTKPVDGKEQKSHRDFRNEKELHNGALHLAEKKGLINDDKGYLYSYHHDSAAKAFKKYEKGGARTLKPIGEGLYKMTMSTKESSELPGVLQGKKEQRQQKEQYPGQKSLQRSNQRQDLY
jgi:hypothetical protein